MRIHIRGAPTYNRDDVEVPPGLTVAELRSRLAALFDIDSNAHFIRLLIRGRLMQDADPLSSYGVEAGSTVNMVVQARQLGSATGATAGLQQPSQEDGGSGDGGSVMSVGVGGGGFPWESLVSAVASSMAISAQQRSVQPPTTTQPGSPQSPAQYQWSWSFGSDRGGGRGGGRDGGRGGGWGAGWGAGRGSVQGCQTPDTTPAPVPPTQDARSRFSLPSLFSGFFSGTTCKGRGEAEAASAAAPPRRNSSCASTSSTSSTTSSTSDSASGADEGDARGVQVRVEVGRGLRAARALRKAQRRARRQAQRAAKDARRDDQRALERAMEEVERAAERAQRDAEQRARQAAEEARRCALYAAQEMQQCAWRAAAELRADAVDWRRIVKHAARDLKTAAGKMSREARVEWHDEAGLQDVAAPPPAARSAPELEPAAPTSTTATTAETSPPSMDVAIDKAASVQLPPPLFPSPKLPPSPPSEPAVQDNAVQQQQPAVVHLHVHCTSDELGDMPLRLRRLAEQVPVAQVVLQTNTAEQDGDGPDSQPRTMLRHTTAAAAASAPPTPDTRGAALRPTTAALTATTTASVPWIDEALSTSLAALGMPQLMQLAAGNYNVLASLREPLQAQVQRRLAGTSGSLAAVAHVAHHEAQQLTTRILGMPAVCQFLEREAAAARAAGRTPDEGRQSTASFRAELPRFLEHLYVAIMQHVRRTSLSAAEWSRELRNIFVRHTGMAMTRSVQWFDEGRQAFQPVVANVMLSLLQSSGAPQQYPMLQTFSSMLGPMLQSLLGEWGREYEQFMQRSEDTITFDQTAAPSSPPQRTSPLSFTPAVTRELQPPPPFAEVVKQTSSLYSDKSLSGGASSLVPPPPPTTPESDCAESHLLPAWNARHLFRSAQSQHRNAVDGGASAATATAAAALATTATTPVTVTTAGGNLDDLAEELMGSYDDGDGDDEKQPSTRAVSPKTRPLDAPPDTTVPAFSVDTGAGESDAAAAAAERSREEAEAEAEVEAVAASQARLAAAVEDWEDSCGVPHAVAERVTAMASRYAEARSLASASLRLSALARTFSAASAPPQPPSVTSITGSVDGSLDVWVTWEANPYGDAPSSG